MPGYEFFVEADRIQYCGNQRASYRWIHEPLQKTQLIGTGSLRLQSEQAGSAGQSRRRVDTGQLHWQEVPPRHRQHRASVRGLPHLIARCYFYNVILELNLLSSLLPAKTSQFRADKKKKSRKRAPDKSKFNPPKDISHGFEPYFRVRYFHLLLQLLHFHK